MFAPLVFAFIIPAVYTAVNKNPHRIAFRCGSLIMERLTGVEPAYAAWEEQERISIPSPQIRETPAFSTVSRFFEVSAFRKKSKEFEGFGTL